ncbi:MAG TPA: hypothetical protein PL096_11080 [Micropepsaceae bacterium]|nr:hypothetical protein [Micropepsaceae bacterium]
MAGKMMRAAEKGKALAAALMLIAVGAAPAAAEGKVAADCTWNGITLNGDVKVVESFGDIKVQIVTSFADLHVQNVTSFPDNCGQWRFVESFPDFTVQFVDSFPDITIEYVTSFPGVND